MNVFVTLQPSDRELYNECANRNFYANRLRDSLDQDKWMSEYPETFEMDVWHASSLLRILSVLQRVNVIHTMLKVA